MSQLGKSRRYNADEVLSSTYDPTNNVQKVAGEFLYSRKTADGQVKATAGLLHTVVVSPTAAISTSGTITIYDSAAESGNVIATIFIPTNNAVNIIIPLDVVCATGIYVGYDATVTAHAVTCAYL